MESVRLTQLSHGGGCGCKIAPAVLSEILSSMPQRILPPQLLVGTDSSDDAAVYEINPEQAIVATTDFFMPIVDDPYDFGRIAATNAISDVYAMGAKPLFALAIVGMPVNQLPVEVIQKILQGGEAICAQAGIPIAGGHTIDSPEPIYGLVVIGIGHPKQIKRNNRAKAGDLLILGKPLGVGVLGAALKKGALSDEGYRQMIDATTRLNTPGTGLAQIDAVHAVTDVTGFGLLGHLLEVARGSSLSAELDFAQVPVMPAARPLAEAGLFTGASDRNWVSMAGSVDAPENIADWKIKLLCDPQTSGGLLVACAPEAREAVLQLFGQHDFADAKVIGRLVAGAGRVQVLDR